jgi:hypothetical protein
MRLSLLSVKELSVRTKDTVKRFAFPALFLFAGAMNHLYMEIFEDKSFKYYSRNIFMDLLLLVPILISLRLFCETGWISRRVRLILESAFIAAALFYFFLLPNQTLSLSYSSQFVVLLAISGLLCFVCIKQAYGNDDFYWNFYATLFIRLFVTGIYTGIILSGTGAALGAIDALFKTHLVRIYELRIVIVTLWIFAPLFFLSGVPVESGSEEMKDYRSIWLKNIGMYVMVPLTIVYLSILYAYGFKILLQWELPEGMVSYLVLSFASYGILTLLVIFPFQKDSKWLYWFSRYFYILQMPLLLLLFVAVFTRVFEYGITFRRYYVLALAVWLLSITIYMVIKKNRNLIFIPLSLAVIALLSILGPWSSFNVSYLSQKGRLMRLLNENGLIQDNKIHRVERTLPIKIRADISSITRYLYDYGKLQNVAYLTSVGIINPESFTKELGFDFIRWHKQMRDVFSFGYGSNSYFVPTSYYNVYIRFRETINNKDGKTNRVQADRITVYYYPKTAIFQFTADGSKKSEIKMKQVIETFKKREVKSSPIEFLYQDNLFDIYCLFDGLSGWDDENGIHLDRIDVDFFIKQKQE